MEECKHERVLVGWMGYRECLGAICVECGAMVAIGRRRVDRWAFRVQSRVFGLRRFRVIGEGRRVEEPFPELEE